VKYWPRTSNVSAQRPIPELGLRRVELGERRVDYDDLLALAYVLQIAPVDLMVNKDATNESYPMTSELKFEAESVREWIRGADIRLAPITAPEAIFADPRDDHLRRDSTHADRAS
jgi:hypothetical protein